MSHTPVEKTSSLRWPPLREEWQQAWLLLGAIVLSAGFFVVCAVLGIDPGQVFDAVFGVPFLAILFLWPVFAVLFLIAALLRK